MANRESLMLSHVLDLTQPSSYSLANWYASEKLDGMRAIWLPDTKGFPVGGLPFANMDKDVKQDAKRAATGLWSRYFKPIWAPDWFTEALPRDVFLDGELWCGRQQFNTLTSIVKRKEADDRWNNVEFRVFDSPSPDQIYSDGKIHKPPILVKNFRGIWQWCKSSLAFDYKTHGYGFETVISKLLLPIAEKATGSPDTQHLRMHPQKKLHWNNGKALEELQVYLNTILEQGGEGVIVRHPMSTWVPKRMNTVLKVKPFTDADATITGFTMGEGRLAGMIGALEVEGEITDEKSGRSHRACFKLGTGLSDSERAWPSTTFKLGDVITYRYRELTPDGIPREGRFLRVRTDL
jgi:DNA ligase-1